MRQESAPSVTLGSVQPRTRVQPPELSWEPTGKLVNTGLFQIQGATTREKGTPGQNANDLTTSC